MSGEAWPIRCPECGGEGCDRSGYDDCIGCDGTGLDGDFTAALVRAVDQQIHFYEDAAQEQAIRFALRYLVGYGWLDLDQSFAVGAIGPEVARVSVSESNRTSIVEAP